MVSLSPASCRGWRTANRHNLHMAFNAMTLILHWLLVIAFTFTSQTKFAAISGVFALIESFLTVRAAQDKDSTYTKSIDRLYGGVFLNFALWAFSGTEGCGWDLNPDMVYYRLLRNFLGVVILWSLLSVGLGILEVDFNVNPWVRELVNESDSYTLLHLVHRCAEITMSITFMVSSCLLLRPTLQLKINWPYNEMAVLVSLPFVAAIGVNFGALYLLDDRDQNTSLMQWIVSSLAVAGISLVANPLLFLRPKHQDKVTKFNVALNAFRIVQFCGFGGLLKYSSYNPFPLHDCPQKLKNLDLSHWLWRSTPLPSLLGTSMVLYLVLVGCVLWKVREREANTHKEIYQDRLRTRFIILDGPECEDGVLQSLLPTFEQVTVIDRSVVIHLLRKCGQSFVQHLAGLDFTKILTSRDYNIKKTASGGYGVVFKVTKTRSAGVSDDGYPDVFAMKLQVRGEHDKELKAYRAIWMTRDRATQQVGHPFILKLIGEIQRYSKANIQQLQFLSAQCPTLMDDGDVLMLEYCEKDVWEFILQEWKQGAAVGKGWLGDCLRYAQEILSALDFLHARDMVHRDLKPENCLLKVQDNGSFQIKVGDLGSAKHVASINMPSFAGTSLFMAPEMHAGLFYKNTKNVEPKKLDIHSFGITLFVMLLGSPADVQDGQGFSDSVKEFLPTIGKEDRFGEELSQLATERRCPESAKKLIESCTNIDPGARPCTSELKEYDFFHYCGKISWDALMLQR